MIDGNEQEVTNSSFVASQSLGAVSQAWTQGESSQGSQYQYQSSAGPSGNATHSNEPQNNPPKRKWFNVLRARGNHKSAQGMEFTVMSYNVLSQLLLENHMYLYTSCAESDIEWKNRSTGLLQEILRHNVDILCLQEVEDQHWSQTFKPCLERSGYQGVFKKRTLVNSDGCAILFKTSKFTLIKSIPVEFHQGGILDRGNVGLILLLQPKSWVYKGDVEKICVATTHLLFNPRRGDIKLAQLILLMAEMDKYASFKMNNEQEEVKQPNSVTAQCSKSKEPTISRETHPYCPTILCGDFNLEPFSRIYQFITRGQLVYENLISRSVSGQREGSYYGSNSLIPRNLIPSWLNITEKCQYADEPLESQKKEDRTNRNIADSSNIPQETHSFTYLSPGLAQYLQMLRQFGPCASHMPPTITYANQGISQAEGSSVPPNSGEKAVHSMPCQSVSQAEEPVKGGNLYNTGQVYHKFNFKSVYQHHIRVNRRKCVEVTTHHDKASCTLDYIFYSSAQFSVPNIQQTFPKRFKDKTDCYGASPAKKWKDMSSTPGESPTKKSKDRQKDKHKSEIEVENEGGQMNNSPIGFQDRRSECVRGHEKASASQEVGESTISNLNFLKNENIVKDSHYQNGITLDANDNQSATSNQKEHVAHENTLQLVARYSLLTSRDLSRIGKLPNANIPSDHFCLISKFILH